MGYIWVQNKLGYIRVGLVLDPSKPHPTNHPWHSRAVGTRRRLRQQLRRKLLWNPPTSWGRPYSAWYFVTGGNMQRKGQWPGYRPTPFMGT